MIDNIDFNVGYKVKKYKKHTPTAKQEKSCINCGKTFYAYANKKFCSQQCYFEKMHEITNKKIEKDCSICSSKYMGTVNSNTCSYKCRKQKAKQSQEAFKKKNPEINKVYNENRVKKDPEYWTKKVKKERLEIIQALGGKCIVCGVTNPNWLHVDYIPTMIGTGYRHPRHKKWVLNHINEFRLLCANHHYELSITGEIEGTDIKQKIRISK